MKVSSRKKSLDEIEEVEDSSMSEEEEKNIATNSVKKSHGHYEATCYYCFSKKSWAREKPAKLEAHLANECSNCSENISRYWQENVAKRKSNYICQKKNSTPVSQASISSHFSPDRPLPKATIN
ncbi:26097_t:CDS:2 [Gigaspora margarita]|uniref:26097_t:CDS:1 n=1 Tax=Gigaspora margarita TaxID=4874 RepID=A0ABN7V1E4_GIGMA|nr:26097_t:CDS:2 [Gigaspora margarita]